MASGPILTAAEMRRLDALATGKYKIAVLDIMEHAGRAVAEETAAYIKGALKRPIEAAPVVVCCGRGSNGGDGLVASRVLKGLGAQVSVFLCPPRKQDGQPGRYPEPARVNLERAKAAGVPVAEAGPESGLREKLAQACVVLDALLGTGSSGKPAGAIHHMIEEINRAKKPVLAVDIPSGLEPDTGEHGGAVVLAAATLTLGFAKRGLLAPNARKFVGELKVLDIGYPKDLIAELGR